MADAPATPEKASNNGKPDVFDHAATADGFAASVEGPQKPPTPEALYAPREVVGGMPKLTAREAGAIQAVRDGRLTWQWQVMDARSRSSDPVIKAMVPNAIRPTINAVRNLQRWGFIEWSDEAGAYRETATSRLPGSE